MDTLQPFPTGTTSRRYPLYSMFSTVIRSSLGEILGWGGTKFGRLLTIVWSTHPLFDRRHNCDPTIRHLRAIFIVRYLHLTIKPNSHYAPTSVSEFPSARRGLL